MTDELKPGPLDIVLWQDSNGARFATTRYIRADVHERVVANLETTRKVLHHAEERRDSLSGENARLRARLSHDEQADLIEASEYQRALDTAREEGRIAGLMEAETACRAIMPAVTILRALLIKS